MNNNAQHLLYFVQYNNFEGFCQFIKDTHVLDLCVQHNICHDIIYERTYDSLKWLQEIFQRIPADQRHHMIDAVSDYEPYVGRTLYLMSCAWALDDVMVYLQDLGADIHVCTSAGETATSIIDAYYHPLNTDEPSSLLTHQRLMSVHENFILCQHINHDAPNAFKRKM